MSRLGKENNGGYFAQIKKTKAISSRPFYLAPWMKGYFIYDYNNLL
ncbi:hypothetical protein [Bacillus benzoevorans]|uniref:Uncharacterized protein n=1 Tax=Bacillus benzoevorans TaxID=1456 RepID=A0A7X0HTM0_9BACI|nr:hypothetical protein [Bacillus benzoevorans]